MFVKKLPVLERLMLLQVLICTGLLFWRSVFTLNLHYTYFLVNLFMAFAPYSISKKLQECKGVTLKAAALIVMWLLFFPYCIYLFSDVYQLHTSDHFPVAYDAVMFFFFAWSGLLPGLMSLKKVETFLSMHLPALLVNLSVLSFIFICSYSTCFVRFLHLTSWNVFADTTRLLHASKHDAANPQNHIHMWMSILTVMFFFSVLYISFKKISYQKFIREKLMF